MAGWERALPDVLVMFDGKAIVEVHPDQGGALGRYDIRVGEAIVEVFRTGTLRGRSGPFILGCNVLVPFSNRISGGGFSYGGRFHPVPTPPGQKMPIHGNGLSLPWSVTAATKTQTGLELASDGPGPFRYAAVLTYTLEAGSLTMKLEVRNAGDESLPFGLGFHPWFLRDQQTRLSFRAQAYWTEDEDHLPDALCPTSKQDGFDFSSGAPLPDGWINNAFVGWDGNARIEWLTKRVGIDVTASPPLRTLIVYSPWAAVDFFCLEPVSHSVDSHNRTEQGTALPQVLAPDESLSAEVTLSPFSLAVTP